MRDNEWWITATKAAMIAEVQAQINAHAPMHYSTTALVEMVFPEMTARGAGIDRRQSLYAILSQAAKKELCAYVTKGDLEKSRFGMIRRNQWHAPYPKCPHCGGTGLDKGNGTP